jgi:hypothetical protein
MSHLKPEVAHFSFRESLCSVTYVLFVGFATLKAHWLKTIRFGF